MCRVMDIGDGAGVMTYPNYKTGVNYTINIQPMTQAEAEAFCVSQGGHIALWTGQPEQVGLLRCKMPFHRLIGAVRLGRSSLLNAAAAAADRGGAVLHPPGRAGTGSAWRLLSGRSSAALTRPSPAHHG